MKDSNQPAQQQGAKEQQKYQFIGKDYPDVELVLFRKDSKLLESSLYINQCKEMINKLFFRSNVLKKRTPSYSLPSIRNNLQFTFDGVGSCLESKEKLQEDSSNTNLIKRYETSETPSRLFCGQKRDLSLILHHPSTNRALSYLNKESLYFKQPNSDQSLEEIKFPSKPNFDSASLEYQGAFHQVRTADASQSCNQGKLDFCKTTESEFPDFTLGFKEVEQTDRERIKPRMSESCSIAPALAYRMLHNNKLEVPLNISLSLKDKLYLANIVSVRNPDADILPQLETDSFIEAVNEQMCSSPNRRNDDKLRWLFKRTLRYFLCKYTNYLPNRSCKREIFMPILLKRFFPNNPEFESELLNSTFASKRKLRRIFSISPLFKQELIDYVENDLEIQCDRELKKRFVDLYQIIETFLDQNPDVLSTKIFIQLKKRIDWNRNDVKEAIVFFEKCISSF